MAESKAGKKGSDPEVDNTAKNASTKEGVPSAAFVKRIVGNAAAPPPLLLLRGYIGPSAQDERTRLYLSPDLAFWLDVPTDAIVHSQEIPPERDMFGATMLWVRQDADVSGGNRWSTDAQ